MSKLIYVHGDDERLFNVVLNALKEQGYSPDYTSSIAVSRMGL